MKPEIKTFNENQKGQEREICNFLALQLIMLLPETEYKIWHRHPVWFINENPIVGYSKLKAGIRLMFWSGASFEEDKLSPGTGKFMDASIIYTSKDEINTADLARWVEKAKKIQWDYKNIYKRKGKLERLS
ncbi:DUF1801 domain-containing protein [Allomuricauda sp. d1]|uniref:DUF1801 domain-containing protein n=1 Tax=Allomuricauda sp. d1 TaxID=3136725 RepID=UPI0031D22805